MVAIGRVKTIGGLEKRNENRRIFRDIFAKKTIFTGILERRRENGMKRKEDI
jgi:hypothetical protein